MDSILKRENYLDNLKVFLTVLVIFHHAGQAYGDGGAWGYHTSNPAEYVSWLWRFFSVNAAFFMGLFFLISGYFIPRSFDKQGFKEFMRKKLMRLGIPTLFILILFSSFSGYIDIGHTWFLEHLLFYSFLYALIRIWIKRTIKPAKSQSLIITLTLVALALSVLNFFIRSVNSQDSWVWLFGFLRSELVHFPQYALMFLLGIVAYRRNWLNNMSKIEGVVILSMGILLSLGIYLGGVFDLFNPMSWPIYEAFLCISVSFGLIWLFREKFNGINRFWKWCATQAFGAYVVHIPLMLLFQQQFDSVQMYGGLGKFLFIGVISTIASFVVAWLLRMIPGFSKVI